MLYGKTMEYIDFTSTVTLIFYKNKCMNSGGVMWGNINGETDLPAQAIVG